MARIAKTRRKKTARRAHEQRQPERRNDNEDGTQNDMQDVSQNGSMQELYDDAEPAEHDSITGDGIPYILNLPNELLNAITTYAVYEKTPVAALRLVNKRFRDCSQTHLVNNLQAKVSKASRKGHYRFPRLDGILCAYCTALEPSYQASLTSAGF